MGTVDDLNAERARLVRRLRELYAARERGEDWDDDEEIRLSRAITVLEAQIQELGGTIEPVPRDDAPPPADDATGPPGDAPASGDTGGDTPAGATTHLGVPPTGIDQQLNDLIDAYGDAQQDAADHALAEREDWTCTHDDPRVHGGCAIWWRGELDNLLAHLRDRANQLLDDLAGPRTQAEFQNDQALLDLRRRELAPLEEEIRTARTRLDELLEQFEEDEQVYKALRDAGGDVGPYTGVVSAGRHRLLFDIAQAQEALTALHRRRTEVLTRLRDLEEAAGSVRRTRGLEEARDRWPDLDLDLDSLTDDELLRRLLGDEQYEQMRRTMQRQGTQMRRQQTRRTSLPLPLPAAAVLIVVLLVALVGAVAVWADRDGDPGTDSAGAVTDETTNDEATEDDTTAEDGTSTDTADTTEPTQPPAVVDECVLVTELELLDIIVEPGSHHRGDVAVRVADDGEPVDGAVVAIHTDKSDGTSTTAEGTTQGGQVVFGMITTAYGPNTITVDDVTMPDCTWSPDSETTLTWQAEP